MRPGSVFQATLVVVGTLLGLWLLYEIRQIVVVVLIAMIFASAIAPLVDRLHHRGLPRAAGILIIYVGLLGVIAALLGVVVPPLARETARLVARLPTVIKDLESLVAAAQLAVAPAGNLAPNLAGAVDQAIGAIPSQAPGLLRVTFSALGTLVSVLLVFVIAFYWLLERDRIAARGLDFLPTDRRRALETWLEIEAKLGAYLRGQLLLGLAVGTAAFVGLVVLGVEFALVLAIVAAVTELIPMIGPIIGAIPAVIIGFSQSPLTGLLVIALYTLIQQLENHILVPKIMERAVGISPLTVLLAILIGGSLMGVVGAILAVPLAAALQVLAHRLLLDPPGTEG